MKAPPVLVPEITNHPAYLGEAKDHQRPTVRACADCDRSKILAKVCARLGWEVTRGICVPHYQKQIASLTGETPD